MTPANNTAAPCEAAEAPKQEIEQLRERHKALHTKSIKAQIDLGHAEQRLEELKEEARRNYGTDDLDELKQLLAARTAENERLRAEYQRHLDEVEGKLAEVEEDFESSKEEPTQGHEP
jgi:chromosome segregation ATPase